MRPNIEKINKYVFRLDERLKKFCNIKIMKNI